MNKTALIGIVIVVVVVLAAIVWGMSKNSGSLYSRPGFEYGSTAIDDTMVGPAQGVEDLEAEMDSTATLDSSVDSDLEQLDKELQGI